MNRRKSFFRLAGGTLAAGAVAGSLGSVALADQERPPSRSAGSRPEHPGAESLGHRRALVGDLQSKAGDGKSLVVDTKHGDITVIVNDKTEFFRARDHEEIKFGDLKVGDRLHVLGRRDGNHFVARRVMVREHHPERRDHDDLERFRGTISEVNFAQRTVTLSITRDGATTSKTFSVTNRTKICLMGGLMQLSAGLHASVVTSDDNTSVALKIKVRPAS
jgi:hypothetical protein